MRRIVFAALTIAAASVLVVGATMAWFTDRAASTENSLTAGTVVITGERNLGDPIPGPMFYTTREEGCISDPSWPDHATGLWFPGMTTTRQLVVYNEGSLHVRLSGLSAVVTGISAPTLVSAWAEKMNAKVYVSNDPSQVMYDGTLAGLLGGAQPTLAQPFIGAQDGANLHLSFEVEMDESAGNNLQGLTPMVEFYVYAVQASAVPLP